MGESMIRIRSYMEGDEATVARLWREVFPDAPAWNRPEDDIRRKLAVQRELFLVAERYDQIVATAMAGYDGHRGWVYYVVVAPAYQRLGIGTILMAEVEQRLADAGCPKLNLQVRVTNEAVVSFYRHLGYDVEARISMGKRLPSMVKDESGDMFEKP